MSQKLYKFYVYIPESHLEQVKNAIFSAGAGQIGNYSQCAWLTKGEGQFCPLEGSNPHIGQINKVEKIIEYKLETVCIKENLANVVSALIRSHPYEMPAYGIIKLENVNNPRQ